MVELGKQSDSANLRKPKSDAIYILFLIPVFANVIFDLYRTSLLPIFVLSFSLTLIGSVYYYLHSTFAVGKYLVYPIFLTGSQVRYQEASARESHWVGPSSGNHLSF